MKREWSRGILLLFVVTLLQAETIKEKYAQSKYCAGCHRMQARDWNSTWHSRSHMTKNPLYRKTLEAIAQKEYKSVDAVAITCAKCHNPRISVKKTDKKFILSKAFGLRNDAVKKVEKALESEHIKEGINCIVCHNVDHIENSTDLLKRGFDAVRWTKENLIVGPFKTHRSDRYHKSDARAHFRENINQLCLVCHYGGENDHGVAIYTTGIEYQESNATKRCADCHMGEHFMGVIAPNVKKEGEPIVERRLRRHLFAGIRNSDIGKQALTLETKTTANDLILKIYNLTPHKVPTGFGGRDLELRVVFFDHTRLISTKSKHFRARFVNGKAEETLPYLATKLQKDTRLKPNEERIIRFSLPKKTSEIKISLLYHPINETLKASLKIEDPVFTKSYPIITKTIKVE